MYYIAGGQERRKDRKSRNEEKVVGFSSASLFQVRKREIVAHGGTMEPEDRYGGEPREPVSSKVGRTSENAGAFQIHSRKTKITRARSPLTPSTP